MRAYSSGVRPCSAAICGVTLISVSIIGTRKGVRSRNFRSKLRGAQADPLSNEKLEQRSTSLRMTKPNSRRRSAVRRARLSTIERKITRPSVEPRPRFHGALRMRHQADHIALAIAEAGDGVERAIGIRVEIIEAGIAPVGVNVAKNDLFVAFEFGERGRVAEIIAFHVRDRHFQNLAGVRGAGEWRVRVFHANVHLAAEEAQAPDCASSRRAAIPLRGESGSRCRCRAPARPSARTRRRLSSPEKIARWRRCADNRRKQTRREE